MAVPQLLVVGLSLGLGLVGTATATDLISLREVARAVDVPLVSGAIIALREAMPGSLAHSIEPALAIVGLGAVAAPLLKRVRGRVALSARQPRLAPVSIRA